MGKKIFPNIYKVSLKFCANLETQHQMTLKFKIIVCIQYIYFSFFLRLQDSSQVIESYKSGFEPPGDVEFEDYGLPMKRTVSETSLTNSRPDNKPDRSSKGKSKTLWPFIKKNKVTRTHTNTSFRCLSSPFDDSSNQKCKTKQQITKKLGRKSDFQFVLFIFICVFSGLVVYFNCCSYQQLLLFVCHHQFPPLSSPFPLVHLHENNRSSFTLD